ncbi:MAG: T9SS type A sorting domain-containing protein [Flavobacteriales bacterium]|nr:T9SS type A sorting domain-containing protein [Flavobacteriales bacterium]
MKRSLPARTAIIAGVAGTVTLFVAWTSDDLPKAHARYHSDTELAGLRGGLDLPIDGNTYFIGSGSCNGCHGLDDIPPVLANHTAAGVDVNPVDSWRSTMMANSAKDPFWRAKVSHEVAVNPAHQAALEDKCTSCHAPMGRYDKFLTGGGHYSIAEMTPDPVAMDGVSCLSCHMQSADSIGQLFSGSLKFDLNDVVYGPINAKNLFGAPMESFVGYAPQYGAHITDAGLCAGCHTLITETADLEGNATGDKFVEQATYHEWLNSVFNPDIDPEGGVTCQGCHMPRVDEPMVISALYDFLASEEYLRTPYGKHDLVGGNTFMLNLLKNNRQELLLTANAVQFDSTIARTTRLLQNQTLLVQNEVVDRTADTAFIAVKLTNLAGHKFPSGYPARRAFVELVVENASGDTLFRSGGWDETYEVMGHDADWEPHHDVIRNEGQAQIYEMVMADVNGDKTTVLERAKESLKDNRLAPLGFTTSHPSYDTTLVVGVPASDIDFNRNDVGVEGSGTDKIHYHVALNGYTGALTVRSRVWYQSAPPRWMEEMFAFNTPEIDAFRTMYSAEDGSPVLVKETEVVDLTTGVDDLEELGVRIYPNPVSDGQLRVDGLSGKVTSIRVFNAAGSLVAQHRGGFGPSWVHPLPAGSGTYLVQVEAGGRSYIERVVVIR